MKASSSKNVLKFVNHLETKTDMATETQRYPIGYKGLPLKTGTLPNISHIYYQYIIE